MGDLCRAMLIRTAIFAAILALTASRRLYSAPNPTCESTMCLQGSTCKVVLDLTSGVTEVRCLEGIATTGNERMCRRGEPLFVDSGDGKVVEATCQRSPNRITCPSGYTCNIAPNDAYAVCCPSGRSGSLIIVD